MRLRLLEGDCRREYNIDSGKVNINVLATKYTPRCPSVEIATSKMGAIEILVVPVETIVAKITKPGVGKQLGFLPGAFMDNKDGVAFTEAVGVGVEGLVES